MSDKTNSVVIATTNPGKIREIKSCLGASFKWLSLRDFEDIIEVEEDGKTFDENARKKAIGYAKATGYWTIADDSGLEIDSLNGEPGVNSARYSGEKIKGEERTLIDHRNIAKVLRLLKDVPKEERTARFICCLCLSGPEEIIIETKGVLEGIITDKEIGTNGFGYDPIFFVPSLNKTVAQLTQEQKNSVSHRGKAIRQLEDKLRKFSK